MSRQFDIEIGPLSLRAEVSPGSIDQTARTVDVVFSTGAPVSRTDFWTGERWIEVLSLKKSAMRLDRLNNGAPFLDSHGSLDVSKVLGVVVPGSAKVTGGEARAKIRFSKREAVEPVWKDITDGILRNVSVGYRVHKFDQKKEQDGEESIPVRTAIDWEPFEISAVPMGADPGAQVRGADQVPRNRCAVTEHNSEQGDKTMDPERDEKTPADPEIVESERDAGAEAEQKRIEGILNGCEAARLPLSFARKLIRENHSLEVAQGMILDTLRKGSQDDKGPRPGGTTVAFTGSDPLENVWRGITGALLNRINPQHFKLDDNARQYRMHSLLRAAEECLEQKGTRTRGLSKMDIASNALGLTGRAGLHTTSDFALILADVANKTLRAAYDAAPQTFQPFSRQIDMPDFKSVKRNQLGEAPALHKVLEHGEFTRGTIGEGKEEFALATYGRIFGITRQALVNDDLDAFGRLTTMFGRSARNLESDLVWYEILANAAMSDGVALFHATHGNLVAGTAISVASIGAGRAAMRSQQGLDSLTYLNIVAKYLVVPPALETIADQFVSANLMASEPGNINPFAGRLTVISEPRLEGGVTLDGVPTAGSASIWYLFASPDQIDIVEWGFLAGQEGPMVESRVGFDIDGLETKCRHDFAAKAIDHRGMFRNGS